MKDTRPVRHFFGALLAVTVALAAAEPFAMAHEQERSEYGARVHLTLPSLPARVRLATPVPGLAHSNSSRDALARAMSSWSKENDTSLRFVWANDGEAALIEVHAVTSGWKWGPAIGAHTDVQSDPFTGEIRHVVIELDATRKWSDEEAVPQDAIDLETVLLHELGHAAGLAHTHDTSAVMRAGIKPGHAPRRALGADDVAGIRAIYPVDATVRPNEPARGNQLAPPISRQFALGGFFVAALGAASAGIRWYRKRRVEGRAKP